MTTSDQTPATPEFRLSPDGVTIGTRAFPLSPMPWSCRTVKGPHYWSVASDAEVADWTPLVPAPVTASTAGLQDRYGHVWMPLPGETDWWWSQCKGIALDRAAIDAEAGPLDEVDAAVPPVPAPATADRDAVRVTPVVLAELQQLRQQAHANARELRRQDRPHEQILHWHGVAGWLASRIRKLGGVPEGPADTAPAVPAADDQERRRIAQVLHDVHCGCDDWDAHESEDDDPSYLLMADAAIAALREVPDA